MLVDRHGERYRLSEALLWSATWGAGAAAGVALGGWLTLVGGAGAPGSGGLEPVSDLVALPVGAFGIVIAVQLAVRLSAAALRGRAHGRGQDEGDQKRAEDDGVFGQLRPEGAPQERAHQVGGGRDSDRRP